MNDTGSAGIDAEMVRNKSTVKLPEDKKDEIIKMIKSQQVKVTNEQNIRFDRNKTLNNNIDGEKFLIIHRTDEGRTMKDMSPILLETALKNATSNGNFTCKVLKSGDILVKTENKKQAEKLIKLVGIMDANIEVNEHKTLNTSKGVMSAYELKAENPERLLEYLKQQNVIDVKMHTKTINGNTFNTGLVFLTFGVADLPEYLTVGVLRIRVRPYIPAPIRCFACHKFGHFAKQCNMQDAATCYNCNKTKHIHDRNEKCTDDPICVNCNEQGHNSYSKNCSQYKRQLDIQFIRISQKVSFSEAVKRSNVKQKTYANVTATETPQAQMCTCAHCDYHKQSTSKTEPKKRERQKKSDSPDLTTDEETAKRMRVQQIDETEKRNDMDTE
jgi:hypothetical protein